MPEAPEAVEVPRSLLRADGRSVYQRHGGIKYATRVQLSMEERMVAQAQARIAPAMTREHAAQLLGASTMELDTALVRRAQDAHAKHAQAQDTQADHTRAGRRDPDMREPAAQRPGGCSARC